MEQTEFLGHIIGADGIRPDPKKLAAIRDWPVPASATDVRAFLGLANYYRRFVKRFADLAAPLHELTGLSGFKWEARHQAAFEALRDAMTSEPLVVHAPDPSGVGIGAVLTQGKGHLERVIAYHSRKLSKAEANYPVHEQEMLALVESLKVWRHYLLGSKTFVRTDNRPNNCRPNHTWIRAVKLGGWRCCRSTMWTLSTSPARIMWLRMP